MSANCPECIESWAADECLPCWEMPSFKCPCLDLTNPDHVALWAEAWKVASSFVFNETGQRWPGKCITETVRPCVPQKCRPSCACYACGNYSYIGIDEAFCWPICEITEVEISPNACNPNGETWTEGDGFRMERVNGCLRLVIEDDKGCCGQFPRQDLCKPMGECDTWSITARTGCNPPPEILRGTAAFACDIAQECIATKCGLPANVSRASFSGITVDYDQGKGKSIDIQMLNKLIDKYSGESIKEQFLNTSSPVTFHHVDGPHRYDNDLPLVPPVCEIEDDTIDAIAASTKNTLNIYKPGAVSPVK